MNSAVSILGPERAAVICREMTKTYEEVIRGSLAELKSWADSKEVLGEITMVISGAEIGAKEITEQELVSRVRELEDAGMERKEAIATVAQELNLAKRLVFDAMVNAKKAQ